VCWDFVVEVVVSSTVLSSFLRLWVCLRVLLRWLMFLCRRLWLCSSLVIFSLSLLVMWLNVLDNWFSSLLLFVGRWLVRLLCVMCLVVFVSVSIGLVRLDVS